MKKCPEIRVILLVNGMWLCQAFTGGWRSKSWKAAYVSLYPTGLGLELERSAGSFETLRVGETHYRSCMKHNKEEAVKLMNEIKALFGVESVF